MKKYRLYAIAALLAVPSMLVSGPGLSTSSLPAIDAGASAQQRQNCPVEGGYGCFSGARPSPFSICQKFMQMFMRPGAG